MPQGYDDQFAEFASGRERAFIESVNCGLCGRRMSAVKGEHEVEWHYAHPNNLGCPNAGKKFKVATVELEELL